MMQLNLFQTILTLLHLFSEFSPLREDAFIRNRTSVSQPRVTSGTLHQRNDEMSQGMRLWYLSQATSEGLGEPAHPCSLARAFAGHTPEVRK